MYRPLIGCPFSSVDNLPFKPPHTFSIHILHTFPSISTCLWILGFLLFPLGANFLYNSELEGKGREGKGKERVREWGKHAVTQMMTRLY